MQSESVEQPVAYMQRLLEPLEAYGVTGFPLPALITVLDGGAEPKQVELTSQNPLDALHLAKGLQQSASDVHPYSALGVLYVNLQVRDFPY
mmetsp:Transcript_1084/g.1416  ORF Transcript_1084/g.1416 Transcript_1084/m.1416 type:complete len:91 (+) Transcript_1084:1158-1430(+)